MPNGEPLDLFSSIYAADEWKKHDKFLKENPGIFIPPPSTKKKTVYESPSALDNSSLFVTGENLTITKSCP